MTTSPTNPDFSNAFIGVSFNGLGADGGIGAIVERNRVYDCRFAYYHDFYSTKVVVVRKNYFYSVVTGPYHNMGGRNADKAGATLTQNGALATFTTAQAHGFLVGSVVTVSGALIGGSSANPYNGTFQIAAVPTPTSFTYAMSSDPGADASGSPVCNGQTAVSLVHTKTLATFTTSSPHGLSFGQAVFIQGATIIVGGQPTTNNPYNGTFAVASVPTPTSFTYVMSSDPQQNASGSPTFATLWQVGLQIIENNVIDLVLNIIPSGYGYSTGILLGYGNFFPTYVFGQVSIRRNVIRNVDNASDASGWSVGIQLQSCENALLEDNIINLNTLVYGQSPVVQFNSGSVKYFNNQTPAGNLMQGYNADIGQNLNELTTDAGLALLQSS